MKKVYEVILHPRVGKELDRLDAKDFRKVDASILNLREDPRPFGVKKLDQKMHRIRVGDWRVIYSILEDLNQIIILHVARRNEKTYRDLSS